MLFRFMILVFSGVRIRDPASFRIPHIEFAILIMMRSDGEKGSRFKDQIAIKKTR